MNIVEKSIVKLGQPIGKADAYLPLELMEPKTFELFCCELIKKRLKIEDGETIDAMTIGIPGQSQFGADIVSHRRHGDQDFYSLYEVKRYKNFTDGNYISAIKRFNEHREKWQVNINDFYILLSEKASAKLISEYKRQEAIFKELNIVHRLLDTEMIHDWLKNLYCPDLLYRFCHESWVSLFYGERALLNIKNYGLWDYNESSAWRNYTHPYEYINGDTYTLQNDHVFIQAFLPNLKGNSLSCFIDFRNGRYNHVLLTMSQNDLLNSAFEATCSPPEAGVRPWVLKEFHGENYYCDIGNCRLELTLNETRSLCDAFDKFWRGYKQRMEEIDRICRTVDFSNSTPLGDNIHLITIPYWLWGRINIFCQHHDYLDTEGEWSIFNPVRERIIVFTHHKDEVMNEGHHVTLLASSAPNFNRLTNHRVALIWQPPSRYDLDSMEEDAIGPRNYWDALTTYRWLMEKLIPAADRWYCTNFFPERRGWQRLPFLAPRHIPYTSDDIYSYFQPESNISVEQVDSKQSLLALLTELQDFYHLYTRRVYFKASEFEQLCDAFLFLLNKTTVNYWGYIRNSIGASQEERESVVTALQKYRRESTVYEKNSSLYDYLFRGMMALFGDGDCHINEVEAIRVATLLRPFVDKMSEGRFLRRCQKRL
ncbi:hypothetical protein ABRQ05_14540 [Pectobacterium actinidiae]|uniref:hypothetical protein n=1 Tax=Pectobacterium actinidiae TaxID=1507808 RepID=UPI0032F04223